MSGSDLILASASPRRRMLLECVGVRFSVSPQDVDETAHPAEAPIAYALRVATAKAAACREGDVVLAADTVVALDGVCLGKARDEAAARASLTEVDPRTLPKPRRVDLAVLAGLEHQVLKMISTGYTQPDVENVDVGLTPLMQVS